MTAKIEKIDKLVSLLHDETDDEKRGKIYEAVQGMPKPRWFNQAMTAAAWAVYYKGLPYGIISPLALTVGGNDEYAEYMAKKLGARQQDFDVCYRLCVEMQWDLLDGENVDVILAILNVEVKMLKLVEIYEPVTTLEEVEQEIKEHEVMFQNMSDEELNDWLNDEGNAEDYYYMMAWDEMKNRKERLK